MQEELIGEATKKVPEIDESKLPDFVDCRLFEDCVYKGIIYPAGQARLPKEAFAKGLREGWVRAS